MKKIVRSVAVLAILAIVAVACGGNKGGTTASGSASASGNVPKGGTLKLALVNDVDAAFDPQRAYYQINFEFEKCCIGRTLFTTNGKPVDEGGSDLLPDIASAMPTVSDDGLTWTIPLKSGIKYSPPFDTTEVTAGDFIRAVMREADPKVTAPYNFYYTPIEGFSDFSSGKADTISGMTAVDDHTLQIKVTEPTGDLGWRLAMPAMAPIPPMGDAQYGAAQGHEKDWGRFQVATGPYMFQGEGDIDFSVPADQQKPAAGYIPGRQIVLVRNPSWDASTDDNRPAYVDEITAPIGGDVADLYNKVDSGEIDEVFDAAPPANELQKYSTNPDLQDQLHIYPQNAIYYTDMNLAVPPFDDIHVRKAMNLIFDKQGMRQLIGGPLVGELAGHIFPDGLTNNLEKGYDPYATPNGSGDATKAKAEMAQSKYDSNGDGLCDADVCKNILAITNTTDPAPRIAALFNQNVQELGMSFDIKALETSTMYAKCNTLTEQVPICLAVGWIQDYPDAYTFGPPLFGGPDAPGGGALYPSCCNYSGVGATPDMLKKWGYSVTSVPSVDDKLNACAALAVGDARSQCWVDLDKYLMENVVPWIPRYFSNDTEITGTAVVNYSYDEFGGIMAIDHIAVSGS